MSYKYKYIGEKIDGINPLRYKDSKIICSWKPFTRIVIGGRGVYIEFISNSINIGPLYIPENELYRIDSDKVYYIEYRIKELPQVKIYWQKKLVDYADYKVGFWYISPIYLEGFVRDGKYNTDLHRGLLEAARGKVSEIKLEDL